MTFRSSPLEQLLHRADLAILEMLSDALVARI